MIQATWRHLTLDNHFKQTECSIRIGPSSTLRRGTPPSRWETGTETLRGQANYCEFGAALELNLMDRFVLGLGPGPEREKLFEKIPSTMSFGKALAIAQLAESAPAVKMVYRSTFESACSRNGGEGTGTSSRSAGGGSGRVQRERACSTRCVVCRLKNHEAKICRFKNYMCNKYGVKGHLKKKFD